MKNRVGIDIVENSRIELKQEFYEKVLSSDEIKMLDSFQTESRKIEFIAGRWAVKEAIFKVLDKGQEITFNKMNIGYINSKPVILNEQLKNISISISHERKYSVGVAFLIEI